MKSKTSTSVNGSWLNIATPVLFDRDHAAWRKRSKNEPEMSWVDCGDFTRNAYALMVDLASTYIYLSHKGRLPATMPDECSPSGFYYAAVVSRDRQVGIQRDELDIPSYSSLSPFSQFIYTRIADRLRDIVAPVDDGLDFEDEL